ncbi:hypothetical protein N7454_008984 [Penicillium verhagenii]|nr:hypothetical protein N7454_008984 [Penicillium verhagenii]
MFVAAALRMFNRGRPDDRPQVLVAFEYEQYNDIEFDDETDGLISGGPGERQRKVRYPIGRSRSESGNRKFFRRRSYIRVEE